MYVLRQEYTILIQCHWQVVIYLIRVVHFIFDYDYMIAMQGEGAEMSFDGDLMIIKKALNQLHQNHHFPY